MPEPERMENTRETTLPEHTGPMHTRTHRACGSRACTGVRLMRSQCGQVIALSQKLSPADNRSQMKKQLSATDSHWGYKTLLRPGLMPTSK